MLRYEGLFDRPIVGGLSEGLAWLSDEALCLRAAGSDVRKRFRFCGCLGGTINVRGVSILNSELSGTVACETQTSSAAGKSLNIISLMTGV